MSGLFLAAGDREPRPRQPGRVERPLAWLGRGTRRSIAFTLFVAALGFAVIREACRPSSWRRTVRGEFRRSMRQAIVGGLSISAVTAVLVGVGLVYQGLYWLGALGQKGLIGAVLVTVLVRSVAPILIGLILLGRSGTVAIAEIGAMRAGSQLRAMEAQGLDIFLLLVLPRAAAFAVASFTLAVVFIVLAMLSGFLAGELLDVPIVDLGALVDQISTAMRAADFVVFPLKTMLIGLTVALTSCLTALEAAPREDAAGLLPRGFVRGVLATLLTSGFLSLAV